MSVVEESNREDKLANAEVKPAKLAHVVLRTANLPQMRDFYAKFLNARVTFENQMVGFLTYDDEHHRIAIIGMPWLQPQTPGLVGMEHFAFTYENLGDLLANYSRLKAEGILPIWTINHGATTSMYYQDPDGNLVEAQFDNMNLDEVDDFLRGGYFAKNPVGVDFDANVLLERYRNGDPVSELVKFKSAPYAEGVPHVKPEGLPPYDCDGEMI